MIDITKIGASDIAAITGNSPWATPCSLWARLVGMGDDFKSSEAMEWGKRLEEPIAQGFCDRGGWDLEWFDQSVTPEDIPFARATPDAFGSIGETTIGIEVKNTSQWWERPPKHYVDQIHWLAFICDRIGKKVDVWHLVALFQGSKLRSWEIEIDWEYCTHLHHLADKFYKEHVLTEEAPINWMEIKPTFSDLKRIFPECEEKTRLYEDSDPQLDRAFEGYGEFHEKIKEYQIKKEKCKTYICWKIKEAASIENQEYIARWSGETRRFNLKKKRAK